MTKRFTLFEDLDIKDKATGKIYPPCLDKGLSELVDLLNQLNDENEQLKTTIQQLRTDNTKQKKLLNTTMKENEHIKQTIKDMINTERTELGKMTLRQLWRQIQ
jgi:DUF438 domain-containing protein